MLRAALLFLTIAILSSPALASGHGRAIYVPIQPQVIYVPVVKPVIVQPQVVAVPGRLVQQTYFKKGFFGLRYKMRSRLVFIPDPPQQQQPQQQQQQQQPATPAQPQPAAPQPGQTTQLDRLLGGQ